MTKVDPYDANNLPRALAYIHSWLSLRRQQERIPGLVVAFAKDGQLLFNKAYGHADVANNVPLTTDHMFSVASHSKVFTATALMQLQEQGILNITDPVVRYVPWLCNHTDKRWQHITLQQLMEHSAGILRDGNNADYWQLSYPFLSTEQIKDELLGAQLVVDNNTQMKYSNLGYALLGMVVEAAAQKPYKVYIQEHILRPLGLPDTYVDVDGCPSERLATGYSRFEAEHERMPIDHVVTANMAAATGFCSTAQDLCTFFSAQFVGSGKLLKDESKKQMQRLHWQLRSGGKPASDGYGLGMRVNELEGNIATFGHAGGFPGFITRSIARPQDKLVVVVLTNCIGGPAVLINKGIYSILDFFAQHSVDTDTHKELTKFEGRFADLFTIVDVVATGRDALVAADPSSWQPFENADLLTKIDDSTIQVTQTGSAGSEGELVHYTFDEQGVASLRNCGQTMWPYATWQAKMQSTMHIKQGTIKP